MSWWFNETIGWLCKLTVLCTSRGSTLSKFRLLRGRGLVCTPTNEDRAGLLLAAAWQSFVFASTSSSSGCSWPPWSSLTTEWFCTSAGWRNRAPSEASGLSERRQDDRQNKLWKKKYIFVFYYFNRSSNAFQIAWLFEALEL